MECSNMKTLIFLRLRKPFTDNPDLVFFGFYCITEIPMKLFLIEWSSLVLHDIARELVRRGSKIAYCTADTQAAGFGDFKKDLSEAKFYDTFDAIRAEGARLSDKYRDLVETLHPYYEETHSMMRRMDYGGVSEDRKKELFSLYVSFWAEALEEDQPDAVVFSVMPHMVYDFVLYLVCRAKGVRTIMYETARINDRVILFDVIGEGSRGLRDCMRAHDDAALPPDMQEYYDAQRAAGGADPFYMRDIGKSRVQRFIPIPQLRTIVVSVFNGTFLKKVIQYLKNTFSSESRLTSLSPGAPSGIVLKFAIWRFTKMTRRYQKEYESLQQDADLNKQYVYAPLHYQPEKNTSPQGGVFVDQIKMVRTLSESLPEGWIIYVKEHPTQWGAYSTHAFQGRWQGYYRELARIPHVALIPAGYSTHKLIARARAVATVTGTAGWEATVRGIAALVFGYPWYMDCTEILRVSDSATCDHAFKRIASGFHPDQGGVKRFMACLDRVSKRGYVENKYAAISTVGYADNAKNMAALIAFDLSQS